METILLALALSGGAERLAPNEVIWQTDYSETIRAAKRDAKLVLIHLVGDKEELGDDVETMLADRRDFLFARIPARAKVDTDEGELRLLDHPSFGPLLGRPGVAIINHKHTGPNHGRVVSILPEEHLKSPGYLAALLDLPDATLSQRTLIWAMRVHPDQPQSTRGPAHADLLAHAERHSQHQANTSNMHHNLPSFANGEIVAESWPWNKCMVTAAIDIVEAWRHSPGHWSAASRPHAHYGYDMKTVGNKWFATGVFID